VTGTGACLPLHELQRRHHQVRRRAAALRRPTAIEHRRRIDLGKAAEPVACEQDRFRA
jgi:hypothetical protein